MFQDLTDEQLDTLDGILKLQLNSTIGRFTHPATSPRVKEKLKEHQVVLGDLLAGTGAERRARRVEREDGLTALSDESLRFLVKTLLANIADVQYELKHGDVPTTLKHVGEMRAAILEWEGLVADFQRTLFARNGIKSEGEDRG